eukprot:2051928-Heterocapsa_arctica.AAC.1
MVSSLRQSESTRSGALLAGGRREAQGGAGVGPVRLQLQEEAGGGDSDSGAHRQHTPIRLRVWLG